MPRQLGFRGRTGIYEILVVNDVIRPLIVKRASSATIKPEAIEHGMRTLREDGWVKVKAGTHHDRGSPARHPNRGAPEVARR